ncbi:hypothetical protein FQR65_LT19541 [Abscondita terminalis]|nr:hypothetical protein FQR65_LT19541 [Abscondita terminalis]
MIGGEDEKLIEVVQLFRQVYDKGHPEFKNKRVKENAWRTIAEMLERTEEDCEQRFSLLRNRFATERRKVRERTVSGSAGGGVGIYSLI